MTVAEAVELEAGPVPAGGAAAGAMSSAGHASPSIVPSHGGGQLIPIRDSARASELARRRWDAVAAAARRGMAKAGEQLPNIDKRGPLAVVEHLVEQHTLNAADPSAPGSTQSFKQVVSMAYPAPAKGEVADAARLAAAAGFGAQAARELLAELRSLRDRGE